MELNKDIYYFNFNLKIILWVNLFIHFEVLSVFATTTNKLSCFSNEILDSKKINFSMLAISRTCKQKRLTSSVGNLN